MTSEEYSICNLMGKTLKNFLKERVDPFLKHFQTFHKGYSFNFHSQL